MGMPRAVVIRVAGTNCDAEMVRAFTLAGAETDLVHLDRLIADPAALERYDLIGFPGGFSYGDDVASGRIFAMRLRERLWPALAAAVTRGVLMIGACNGFQVMVQVGLLPGHAARRSTEGAGASRPAARLDGAAGGGPPPQTCSLTHNIGGRFIDRWVRVVPNPASPCIWTRPLVGACAPDIEGAVLRLPVAHGEGRFVTDTPETLAAIEANHQVALRYAPGDNPNGSANDIAGICDPSGRIFALMPHPERYLAWENHPFWTRLPAEQRRGDTPGLRMFKAAVEAAAAVPA
jgi:phosphoribosylformylglycinamidine synthase